MKNTLNFMYHVLTNLAIISYYLYNNMGNKIHKISSRQISIFKLWRELKKIKLHNILSKDLYLFYITIFKEYFTSVKCKISIYVPLAKFEPLISCIRKKRLNDKLHLPYNSITTQPKLRDKHI